MSQHRYRFLGRPLADDAWEVTDPDEVRHALQILRLVEGAVVEVSDGSGHFAVGELAQPTKKSFRVVNALVQTAAPVAAPMAIGLGALKPGHVDDLVPFVSEVGLDELHVFTSEGVAKARLGDKQLQRWERIAMQSIKQCKRPWVLQIRTHDSLEALVESEASRFTTRGVLDENGRALGELDARQAALLICGGEKGFSESECNLLNDSNFGAFGLGPYILQARHAACAAAATLAQGRLVDRSLPKP